MSSQIENHKKKQPVDFVVLVTRQDGKDVTIGGKPNKHGHQTIGECVFIRDNDNLALSYISLAFNCASKLQDSDTVKTHHIDMHFDWFAVKSIEAKRVPGLSDAALADLFTNPGQVCMKSEDIWAIEIEYKPAALIATT